MILLLIFLLQAILFLYTGGKNIQNKDTYIKIISLIFLYQGFMILNTIIQKFYICNTATKYNTDLCKTYNKISYYIFALTLILLPILAILSFMRWNIIRSNNVLYITTIILLIYSFIMGLMLYGFAAM